MYYNLIFIKIKIQINKYNIGWVKHQPQNWNHKLDSKHITDPLKNSFGKETVKLEAVANNNLVIMSSVIAIKDGKETQGWVVLFDFIFIDIIQI